MIILYNVGSSLIDGFQRIFAERLNCISAPINLNSTYRERDMAKSLSEIRGSLDSAKSTFSAGSANDGSWVRKNGLVIHQTTETFEELGFNPRRVMDFLAGKVTFEDLQKQSDNFHSRVSGPRPIQVAAAGIGRLRYSGKPVREYHNSGPRA